MYFLGSSFGTMWTALIRSSLNLCLICSTNELFLCCKVSDGSHLGLPTQWRRWLHLSLSSIGAKNSQTQATCRLVQEDAWFGCERKCCHWIQGNWLVNVNVELMEHSTLKFVIFFLFSVHIKLCWPLIRTTLLMAKNRTDFLVSWILCPKSTNCYVKW